MTPYPQMEDRFIEVMATLVQERIRTEEERKSVDAIHKKHPQVWQFGSGAKVCF